MDYFIIAVKLFSMLPTLIGCVVCVFTILGAYVFNG